MRLPISAIILTYNEEKNIHNCLQGICDLLDEIFIVDSGSTDRTKEIARAYTDKLFFHPFENHAKQWNWAFNNLPLSNEWCIALDADQRLTEGLKNELNEIFKIMPGPDIKGFYINRRQVFWGKWIRFGGYYPKYLLRLFRAKEVSCDERELVDKRFYVSGRTGVLKHDIIEDNSNENDLSFWISKHNRYSGLLAQEELRYRKSGSEGFVSPSLFGNFDQKTLWLKGIYYRLPLYVRPFIYFFYRYFVKLGFLDGKTGFVFHFLQGFWYRMLVDIKISELKRKKAE